MNWITFRYRTELTVSWKRYKGTGVYFYTEHLFNTDPFYKISDSFYSYSERVFKLYLFPHKDTPIMKLAESTKASVSLLSRGHTQSSATWQVNRHVVCFSHHIYYIMFWNACQTQTGLKCVRVKSEAWLGSKMWFETAYNNWQLKLQYVNISPPSSVCAWCKPGCFALTEKQKHYPLG